MGTEEGKTGSSGGTLSASAPGDDFNRKEIEKQAAIALEKARVSYYILLVIFLCKLEYH